MKSINDTPSEDAPPNAQAIWMCKEAVDLFVYFSFGDEGREGEEEKERKRKKAVALRPTESQSMGNS